MRSRAESTAVVLSEESQEGKLFMELSFSQALFDGTILYSTELSTRD